MAVIALVSCQTYSCFAADVIVPRERVPWTTSRVVGTPDPPDAYVLKEAFPEIHFDSPLAVARISGSNDFLIAEQHGRIMLLTTSPEPATQLVVDTERSLFGIAVHPDFAANGQIFIAGVEKPDAADGTWLTRLVIRRNGNSVPPDDVMATEEKLLDWLAGGHNGGCLRFGPDGYLYISTGDGSGWSDWNVTGQKIDDLLASILRIDVNNRDGNRAYAIPQDNPFVDVEGARGEVWSYGHRNVWKFSFDDSGLLWAGDVGQDLWEMLLIVQKGGNYGWSVWEGSHEFLPDRELGPTPVLKPLVEHPHSDFRSITGGYVWKDVARPDLVGHYLYGDYDMGCVWALKYVDGKVQEQRRLASSQRRIVAFAETASGEILVLDHIGGSLHRLVPAPPPDPDEPDFPRLLSETGLFASTAEHIPAPGVLDYVINSPLWSDGSIKDRFMAVPGDAKIEFDGTTWPTTPPGWRFPDGTVLVKTFSLETESGNPDSTRRLETRLLHHKRMLGDDDNNGAQVWNGYTYVWNDDQTDAELLDAGGLDQEYTIRDESVPGGTRRQIWHYPSRSECTLCHTMAAKYALGVTTAQMNRMRDDGHGHIVNQLTLLEELGLFAEPLPALPDELPQLADPADEAAPIADRARSYLHANCSHCHRLWGGGLSDMTLTYDVADSRTATISAKPRRGDFGLPDAALILPGHPDRSVLLHRMTRLGIGRMPHVASSVRDETGIDVIRRWIDAMEPE